MRRTVVAVLGVLVLLAAACGSRIPEDQFNRIVIGAGPSEAGLAAGPNGGDGAGLLGSGEGVELSGIGQDDGGDGGGTSDAGGGSTSPATTGGASGGSSGGSSGAGSGGTSGGGTGGGTGGGGSNGGSGGTTGATGGSSGGSSGGGSSGGGSSGGTSGGTSGDSGGGGQPNTASDVGVTPDTIKVGMLYSRGGPLGPSIFTPPVQGAAAYFQWLNANGGVNGRRIDFSAQCDDAEDPQRNRQCVDRLVNQEQVFALVATSTRAYAGAADVSNAGVPDVGGEPIGNEYWTYPTLFTIRGSEYPRDGETGHDGRLYGQTLQFRWAREQVGISTVGVVHYDIPASASFGDFLERAAEAEGLEAHRHPVNAAFPNFDTVVANMQSQGVDAIWDAMDATGNEKLCEAMQRKGFRPKFKLTTSQGWRRTVGDRLSEVCRSVLYALSESRPNADTDHPQVATFREVIRKVYGDDYDRDLAQWALEGWAAAKMFTDGVRSMGANVTRAGLIDWLNALDDYEGEGLLSPTEFVPVDFDRVEASRACQVIARWDEAARNFLAATPVPYCVENSPWIDYAPAN